MMESVNNQGKFQETEEIFIFLHSTSYLKLLLVGSYWSQLSNMKYHQNIWIRSRAVVPLKISFPATVIEGRAAEIKNIKVRVYLSNASLSGFFFFTKWKDTKKTRDALLSSLYACVYSSSFRLARVVIVSAINYLANVIMPLVLYLLFSVHL